MKSTVLADLFYQWGINPFYLVSLLVFFIPIGSFVFFTLVTGFTILNSVLFTLVLFGGCCFIFYLYFHRNPQREIQPDPQAIFSPADGKVVYVKSINQGEIIESVKNKNQMKLTELMDITDSGVNAREANGYVIGIELQLFDVHVTRAPMSGKKVLDHHVSGRIVAMTNPHFEFINDRETVVIKEPSSDASGLQVAVVQIATFITRTVKSFVRDKTKITQGDLLGMIRLGSQVDVIIFSTDVFVGRVRHSQIHVRFRFQIRHEDL